MAEVPKIESAVEEKIDAKIEAAQLPPIENLDTADNVASKTTAEQDRKSAGQRGINETWEETQKKIALFGVYATMTVAGAVIIVSLLGRTVESVLIIAAFTFMTSTTSLIVGFYFSRTNHARIGDDPKQTNKGLDDR